ncbi:hypothetical protein UG55_103165 [Frankia sp. EI5c]|uniref:hypothetical protein n=1 Tax=Frankia sp. EI5c TaxID=683316 RepID=UPI0007C20BE3|nr:hypothetical protein [Frankia sp. EI5c]OAA24218.1 hypothetical protein UG55_103165 [Frankia sp. EI5c]
MRHITRTQARQVTGGRRRRGTRLVVGGLAGAAIAMGTLTGCGGDDALDDLPTRSPRPTPPGELSTALRTALPTALTSLLPTSVPTSLPGIGTVDTATGADALKGTNIPPGFPVPPGATVEVGATAGSRSTLTMRGVDADAARTFYRRALPEAGYEITSDVGVAGIANSLAFRGHGVTGTIAAAGVGSADAIAAVFEKQ